MFKQQANKYRQNYNIQNQTKSLLNILITIRWKITPDNWI